MLDRRFLLAGLAAAAAVPAAAADLRAVLEPLRAGLGPGGRLGVAALDTGSGRAIGFDDASRYAMCSVFKAPLAAAVLAEADRGALALSDELRFGRADLVGHAPVTRVNAARGRLTAEQLCAAAVEVSDNGAANVLLRRIGGPEALTAFFRRCGDQATRLDRTEPELNTNLPGDPRDTTTPQAMVGLLRATLLGDALQPASRERLAGWMERATTGRERLRAGLPRNWRSGDKTGTGANGAANDVAVAWPPNRAPVLIACFVSGGTANLAARNAVHAAVGRAVSAALG